MRITNKIKLAWVGLSLVVGVFSALIVIGRTAQTGHVLALYIAGFVGGAAAASFFWGRKKTTGKAVDVTPM